MNIIMNVLATKINMNSWNIFCGPIIIFLININPNIKIMMRNVTSYFQALVKGSDRIQKPENIFELISAFFLIDLCSPWGSYEVRKSIGTLKDTQGHP